MKIRTPGAIIPRINTENICNRHKHFSLDKKAKTECKNFVFCGIIIANKVSIKGEKLLAFFAI